MSAEYPEQRVAGERAARAGIAEAIETSDPAAIVRRFVTVAAMHGHDGPAVAAFVLALAQRVIAS